MKRLSSLQGVQIIIIVLLALSAFGFFYFEGSLTLRILIILLGIIGVSQIAKFSELPILLTVYLALYDLYNMRYGFGIPTFLVMILVFFLSAYLFYAQLLFNKAKEIFGKNILMLYLTVVGLSVVELYLTMGFWPVDPRTKSIVIMIVFYGISRIIYLYANSMLSLRRAIGFLVASVLVLGLVILLGANPF